MNLENAELLTEEGRLLQQIQGDDNDIDGKWRKKREEEKYVVRGRM